jgi:hypothetical protein
MVRTHLHYWLTPLPSRQSLELISPNGKNMILIQFPKHGLWLTPYAYSKCDILSTCILYRMDISVQCKSAVPKEASQ